jgi:hypothetical protein
MTIIVFIKTLVYQSFLIPIICMHRESGELVSRTTVCICNTCLGVRAIKY